MRTNPTKCDIELRSELKQMLPKVEELSDWKSKYQAALNEFERHEREWQQCEALLRKAVSRVSIVGRGQHARLDKQLRQIQTLTTEKQDQKLAPALDQLGDIARDLEDPAATGKHRLTDPIMLLLELLQNIQFNDTQRSQLRQICSELLKSVARGHDRDSISTSVQQLSALINENFGQVDTDDDGVSIDTVITTLLERLSMVQGTEASAQKLKARLGRDTQHENWADILNEIVNSVSTSLKKLDQEKRELESYILNVTAQLGDITRVISEDQKNLQSNQEDASSLHQIVQQGMNLIQDNFQSANDLRDLKAEISKNIDAIRGGVDDFVERFQERNEATEERNLKLSEQLSQMEQETQELQVMLTENREKLMFDALTGAYSRTAYDEQINRVLTHFTRHDSGFSYVIFDIDHFKRINDTYGHNAGDKALKIVAQLMQQNLRKSDHVFRIGGEEFVLLLSNTPAATADAITQKLRATIAASSFHFKGEPVQLTLSAGITETRPGDSVESIYERADKALYKAKNSGRNCQIIAD